MEETTAATVCDRCTHRARAAAEDRAGVGVSCLVFDGALTPLREADHIKKHRLSPTRGWRLRAAAGQGGEGT